MNGVVFSHPKVGKLALRLPPTSVEWSFKLNTNVVDTAGGQVVQILSISYDKLTLQGQFGHEGPHGFHREGEIYRERTPSEFFNLSPRAGTAKQPMMIGLTQMTQYFRTYFVSATQGGDAEYLKGRYNQEYMSLKYKGGEDDYEREWLVYPTSFPSYKRSKEDFAPEWQVEFQVVEPDFNIDKRQMLAEIHRLQEIAFGYTPANPFSDPLIVYDPYSTKGKKQIIRLTQEQLDQLNDDVLDYYGALMPALDPASLETLINMDASLPYLYSKELKALLTGNSNLRVLGGEGFRTAEAAEKDDKIEMRKSTFESGYIDVPNAEESG